MTAFERAVIRNRSYAQQIRIFKDLRYGNITTDIDAMIEYHNKGYIFIEMKYGSVELSNGQRIALERLNDDLTKSGKEVITILACHNTHDDIDVANAIISKVYRHGKWRQAFSEKTVKLACDAFIKLL